MSPYVAHNPLRIVSKEGETILNLRPLWVCIKRFLAKWTGHPRP